MPPPIKKKTPRPPATKKSGGGWITGKVQIDDREIEVRFESAQRGVLSKYLDDTAIDRLEQACITWAHFYEASQGDLTIGQVKKAMSNIEKLSTGLAFALNHADNATGAILRDIRRRSLQGFTTINELQKTLEILATELCKSRESLPSQSRKPSSIFWVGLIDKFLADCRPGTGRNKNDGAPFREIIEVCFDSMGIKAKAKPAIEAYNKHLKLNSPQ